MDLGRLLEIQIQLVKLLTEAIAIIAIEEDRKKQ